MGKLPSLQVNAKDVSSKSIQGASNDYLTISPNRKPGSSLPPVFPSCPKGKMIIQDLFQVYFAEIDTIEVLSPELGWVEVKDSAKTF